MRRAIVLLVGTLLACRGFAQSNDSATTITPSVPPGSYSTDQIVALIANDESTLFFTFDESRDKTPTRYTVPMRLYALEGESRRYTLRVEAIRDGVTVKQKELVYVIDRDPPESPSPTAEPGMYFAGIEVGFITEDLEADDAFFVSLDDTFLCHDL